MLKNEAFGSLVLLFHGESESDGTGEFIIPSILTISPMPVAEKEAQT